MSALATHDVESYMAIPYQIILTPEYGAWTATLPDLPGCMAVGETPQEALDLLQDAKRSWVSASIEKGLPIPAPTSR
jgi:predicted RNase H-like HicB family nuclease